VNDGNAELGSAFLNCDIHTLERNRRQKDAIGQIFQMIVVAADAHFALDTVVIRRREIGIVGGPIFAPAVVLAAFEIALAEPTTTTS
jgi:hypothetical protein